MIINNTPFVVDLGDILTEWRNQLIANDIPLLRAVRDTPDNIMVSCIYHKGGQERKPSAGIKKSDGTYHCFACGETHTLQEVISHSFGYTDDMIGTWGWNWLLKNFLTIAVEERKDVELDFTRNTISNSGRDGLQLLRGEKTRCEVGTVSEEELDSYRYTHPYMYKRRLTDEIIELFDIGYDHSTKCITFPIRDSNGRTLFVARRSVVTKFFNYPSGVEKPVYGLYELNNYFDRGVITNVTVAKRFNGAEIKEILYYPKEVIICESMLDALTCWVYGKYAVALNGLGNDLQFEQLRKMPCRKFILATDMDEAGRKARARIRKNVTNKLITEYVWDVNIAKDINDMNKDMFDNLEEVF